ncbi:zinc finger protein CONSTANS-LIKE 9-like [Olea europaea var. sylvestris]|uniref:zinc finger protein CONSTANS-LIKE 9-like n=1 Tax=Olea europaea var. sylvestris TaxID=158386 RepID=UPI000C1CF759|nr:zinc finger protein CONSTANS-LIKE 9-like [Olea europaea var. sylvestris]
MRCTLCKRMARIYCESDQASLCWDCDVKVHSANFLVARHSRNLLCHVCQSPMPWSASGWKLVPTVSVCEKCVDGTVTTEEQEEDDEDESNVENEVEPADEDEEEDNQVVPWSSTSPPPASSSSSEGSTIGEREVRRKRMHEEISNEDHGCSSSQPDVHTPPLAAAEMVVEEVEPSLAPPKIRKIESDKTDRVGLSELGILESLRRFDREEMASGAKEFCRDISAVDYDSCDSS